MRCTTRRQKTDGPKKMLIKAGWKPVVNTQSHKSALKFIITLNLEETLMSIMFSRQVKIHYKAFGKWVYMKRVRS